MHIRAVGSTKRREEENRQMIHANNLLYLRC